MGTRGRVGTVVALAAALVVGIVGVWGQQASPTDADTVTDRVSSASEVDTATAPDRRPSPGCGERPTVQAGATADLSLEVAGQERTYALHLPRRYEAGHPLPLVLAYHGRGNDAELMEAQSGLSNLPAIVAYPEGVVSQPIDKRAWQSAPYAPEGVDDIAFTEQLLDRLQSSLCVDLDRVYSVGHSNGGGFAAEVGCELDDEFAAVAVVSAALYGDSVACDHPMSLFELHGTDDVIIPYAGVDRPAVRLPNVAALVREQAAVNGCAPHPSSQVLNLFVTRFAFGQCPSGHAVRHMRVRGGGHGWYAATIGGRPLYVHIWDFLRSQPT